MPGQSVTDNQSEKQREKERRKEERQKQRNILQEQNSLLLSRIINLESESFDEFEDEDEDASPVIKSCMELLQPPHSARTADQPSFSCSTPLTSDTSLWRKVPSAYQQATSKSRH